MHRTNFTTQSYLGTLHRQVIVPMNSEPPAASRPEGVAASPAPAATLAASLPFAAAELRACVVRPQRLLDVVLVERQRLVASVLQPAHLLLLVGALLVTAVAFAVPFGLVEGARRGGHVALLFLGSVLLCFPSLQVFGSYLGVRLTVAQNLALALLIPSAAALFAFGFFPIHWFLLATTASDASLTTSGVRIALLAASLLLGMSHCNRCLFLDPSLKAFRSSWPLWIAWQALLVFITWRMARALDLLA